jgi:hypothetical protein
MRLLCVRADGTLAVATVSTGGVDVSELASADAPHYERVRARLWTQASAVCRAVRDR